MGKMKPFRTRKAAARAARNMPTTRGYTKWKPYMILGKRKLWWIESHRKKK